MEQTIIMDTQGQYPIFEKWKNREFGKEEQNTNENSDELFYDAMDIGGNGESGYSSPCPNNDSENEEDENIKDVLSKVNVKDFYRIEMENEDTYEEDPYISKKDCILQECVRTKYILMQSVTIIGMMKIQNTYRKWK